MTVIACLKWTVPPGSDDRFGGISAADAAALEWALRLGEQWRQPVVAVALGPAAAARALRDALACGAEAAHRIDASTRLASATVGAALADLAAELQARVVCCGDYSSDRGTGSVPAFIAAELDTPQALGLVGLEIGVDHLVGLRRLDGGRRERVRLTGRCVISVEGGTATLRRAPLGALLDTPAARLHVHPGPTAAVEDHPVRPYRPRPRVCPAPAGDTALARIRSLLTSSERPARHSDPIQLEPSAAAERILAALTDWGYLP
jgi:electron transfer flavoprotein beta subunit